MNDATTANLSQADTRPHLDSRPKLPMLIVFLTIVVGGLGYALNALITDVNEANAGNPLNWAPVLLLGLALLIALGFEFVNGFHDTANAVATVIYTHSLPPNVAVVWSGLFNFFGVLTSSGAVAFGIISLLPVELILQVGSGAGFAMVFALLIAAILWNLGTWWLGLPASSSHTLIGSVIGVGIANALMRGKDGTSGVDWEQATKIGQTLLISPLIGFFAAALLLLVVKALVKNPALYREPHGKTPPPWWIRGLLILTCTGVSFAHGSNDGQKGMGLIMLILVGTVPTAYALNRAMPLEHSVRFSAVAEVTAASLNKVATVPAQADTKATLTAYIRDKAYKPEVVPALAAELIVMGTDVRSRGELSKVPLASVSNVRNQMYLASEAIRLLTKRKEGNLDKPATDNVKAMKAELDRSTKFIPLWVKVAVAIALGLGTMVGWKRIVVTVGEKIGKTHLTYAQGASAELVAMATIAAADNFGLPVSTTHVLSSGVAGTMAANRSGLQMSTLRNLAMAWVLTLPAAICLSGGLYYLLSQLFVSTAG